MITNRNVQRAKCGACGQTEYIEDGDRLTTGYYIQVTDYSTHPDLPGHKAATYVCRETHIGKAARAALMQAKVASATGPYEHEQGAGGGQDDSGEPSTDDMRGVLDPDDSRFLDEITSR